MEIAGLDTGALPSVLAIPLAEYESEPDPLLALWHLCDVTELTLRTLTALGLADWVAEGRGTLPKSLVPEFATRIEQPTLGKWRGLVLALGKKAPKGSRIPELYPCIAALDPLIRGEAGVEHSILELRNRLAHGGGMSRGMAGRLLEAHADRFAQVACSLSWLSSWSFVAPGAGVLRGPTLEATECSDTETALAAACTGGHAHAVAAVCQDRALGLWPLIQYGVPRASGLGRGATQAVPLVYARRGEVRLALTPLGSDEVAMAESCEDAVAFLVSLCVREDLKAPRWQVPGFEAELRRDAGQLVGRDAELEILRAVCEGPSGARWVTGSAGIGKSFLMAKIAHERATPQSESITLGYRFKAGDPRTSRDAFLRFAVERLAAWRDTEPPNARRALQPQLVELLDAPGPGQVVFVLDGLDELHAVDASFAAEVPLALADKALWLCSGRPGSGLGEAFGADFAVFEGGVPGLSSADVRSMLLAKIGPLSKRLLRGDRGASRNADGPGASVNPFVDAVVERAGGIPLYVAYVIGDILSGRLTDFDKNANLPPSLEAYHRELLSGSAVGSVQQLLTPILCALALAQEPLSCAVLFELMTRRGLCTADAAGEAAVNSAIAGAAAMLRRTDIEAQSPADVDDAGADDGLSVQGSAYSLFHLSLRDHLRVADELSVALATARIALADAAALASTVDDPATAGYLFRHGIVHLIDAQRADQAAALLADLGYLVARLDDGGPITGVLADLRRVRAAGGDAPGFGDWAAALPRIAHLIARTGATALIQAAVAHADGSAITASAEAWLEEHGIEGAWFRRVDRPEQAMANPCLRTFEGHDRRVTDVTVSAGKVVSAGGDASLRVWELDTGREIRTLEERQDTLSFAMVTTMPTAGCLRELDGHGWTVWSVAATEDGRRVVAAHGDRTVKVWDLESGAVLRSFKGHEGYVWAVVVVGDRVVSAGDDRRIRVWDLNSGECMTVLEGHQDWISALVATPDGRGVISAGGDRTIRVWDLQHGTCVQTLGGHKDYISCLAIDDGGRTLISGSGDGSLARWDLLSSRALDRWPAHAEGVWSVASCERGLLSAGRRGMIHLWDRESREKLTTLRGHAGWVWQVRGLEHGLAISASDDRTLKLWDLDAAIGARSRPCHDGPIRALVALGERVVSAGADGALKLWDPAKGRSLRTVGGHDGEVRGVAPCGRGLVSIGGARSVRWWSAGLEPIETLELAVEPTAVACAAEQVIVGAADGSVCVRRDQGWLTLGSHSGAVTSLAVSADGAWVASGGADGKIQIYDLAAARLQRVLQGHTWDVQALAFTDGGDQADVLGLVSASRDRSIMIWEPHSGRNLATHTERHRGESAALAVLPGGGVLSAADGKTLEAWGPEGRIASWPGEATATAIVVLAKGWVVLGDVAGGITCLELSD